MGIKKYGTTLEENNHDDFLVHAQEEAMDLVNYLEKLIQDNKNQMSKVCWDCKYFEVVSKERELCNKDNSAPIEHPIENANVFRDCKSFEAK